MEGVSIWEELGFPWGTPLVLWVAAFISCYALLGVWGAGGRCSSKARMDGKVVLVTGANTGIGLEAAKDLWARGAEVHLLCRNVEKGAQAAAEVGSGTKVWQLDLSSLSSVRKCANSLLQELTRVDVLLNNAGLMACPLTRSMEGHELQFATNHLGPFLLTNMLLPLLRAAPAARVVTVSSMAHKTGAIFFDDLSFNSITYRPFKAYGQSKLANILFTKELARREREAESNVTANCLHPGVVKTELTRHKNGSWSAAAANLFYAILSPALKSPKAGAQTSIFCAVDQSLDGVSGLYFVDCAEGEVAKQGLDMEAAARLWEQSELIVAAD